MAKKTIKRPVQRATQKTRSKTAARKTTVKRPSSAKRTLSSGANSKFNFEDIMFAYEDMKEDIVDSIGDIVENSLSSPRARAAKGKSTAATSKAMAEISDRIYDINKDTAHIRDTLDDFVKNQTPKKNSRESREKEKELADTLALALSKLSKKKVVRVKTQGYTNLGDLRKLPLSGDPYLKTGKAVKSKGSIPSGARFVEGELAMRKEYDEDFEASDLANLAGWKLRQYYTRLRMKKTRSRQSEATPDALQTLTLANMKKKTGWNLRSSMMEMMGDSSGGGPGLGLGLGLGGGAAGARGLAGLGKKLPKIAPKTPNSKRWGSLVYLSEALNVALAGVAVAAVFGDDVMAEIYKKGPDPLESAALDKFQPGLSNKIREERAALMKKYGRDIFEYADFRPSAAKRKAFPKMSTGALAVQGYLEKQRELRRGDPRSFRKDHPVVAGAGDAGLYIGEGLGKLGKMGLDLLEGLAPTREERRKKFLRRSRPSDGAQLPNSPYSSNFGHDRIQDMRNSAGRIPVGGPSSRSRLPAARSSFRLGPSQNMSIPQSVIDMRNSGAHISSKFKSPTGRSRLIWVQRGKANRPSQNMSIPQSVIDMRNSGGHISSRNNSPSGRPRLPKPVLDAKKELVALKKVKMKIVNRRKFAELIHLLGELSKVQDKIKRTYQNSMMPEMADTIAMPMKDEEARLIQQIMELKAGLFGDNLTGGSGSSSLSGSAGNDLLNDAPRSMSAGSLLPSIGGPETFSQRFGGSNRSYGTYLAGGTQVASLGPIGGLGGGSRASGGGLGGSSGGNGGSGASAAPAEPYRMPGGPLAGSTVGGMITGGAGPSAKKYRPEYKLGPQDLSDEVVRTIAGEAIVSNPKSVDAVINVMMNRVGSKEYGPSGNLLEVAGASGQFAGYNKGRPTKAQAEMIRKRIREIASGREADITNGANEFRAAYYQGPWAQKHANDSEVIGGNRFAKNPRSRGKYHTYDKPQEGVASSASLNGTPIIKTARKGGGNGRYDEKYYEGIIKPFDNHPERKSSISGMNSETKARLGAMLRDAPADIKKELTILSGHRDQETQNALYARNGGNGMVAKHSQHTEGFAFDLASKKGGTAQEAWNNLSPKAQNWITENAGTYGLYNPLDSKKYGTSINEPWHFEPIGNRGNWASQPNQPKANMSDWNDPGFMEKKPVKKPLAAIKRDNMIMPQEESIKPPPKIIPPQTIVHPPEKSQTTGPGPTTAPKAIPAPLPAAGAESVPASYKKATQKAKNHDDAVMPATNSQGLTAPWFA